MVTHPVAGQFPDSAVIPQNVSYKSIPLTWFKMATRKKIVQNLISENGQVSQAIQTIVS
jgi:hypothetical protein